MNIYSYLLEIKNRCLLFLLTWLSVFFVGYFYKEVLLFVFLELEVLSAHKLKLYYFIFTDAVEVFVVFIRLALFFSFQFSTVYGIYHVFVFLTPSFFSNEYFLIKYFLKFLLCTVSISIVITKYFFIPITLDFFFNFQNVTSANLYFEAKIKNYLDFYIKFYYIFVVYFLSFGVLFLLLNSIISNITWFKRARKVNYLLIMLFSTSISPPDVFSQLIIFLVLFVIYEFFVLMFLVNYFLKKVN